jgi:hypothetical protein
MYIVSFRQICVIESTVMAKVFLLPGSGIDHIEEDTDRELSRCAPGPRLPFNRRMFLTRFHSACVFKMKI